MYLTGKVKNKTMEQQSISFLSFLFKALSFFLDLGRIFLDPFLSYLYCTWCIKTHVVLFPYLLILK